MSRPAWDETWLEVARVISRRSLCVRTRVGAVAVTWNNRVAATGYNGPPAGMRMEGPCRDWCERGAKRALINAEYGLHCPSVHAEMNTLVYVDRSRVEGGTLYVTSSVCGDCAKVVANSGIGRVVMRVDPEREAHRNPDGVVRFLTGCDVKVDVFEKGRQG